MLLNTWVGRQKSRRGTLMKFQTQRVCRVPHIRTTVSPSVTPKKVAHENPNKSGQTAFLFAEQKYGVKGIAFGFLHASFLPCAILHKIPTFLLLLQSTLRLGSGGVDAEEKALFYCIIPTPATQRMEILSIYFWQRGRV